MTVEREELERIVKVVTTQRKPVMAAADAYGDARELKGHVAACQDCARTERLGDGWYCPKAPIQKGASEHGDGR